MTAAGTNFQLRCGNSTEMKENTVCFLNHVKDEPRVFNQPIQTVPNIYIQ